MRIIEPHMLGGVAKQAKRRRRNKILAITALSIFIILPFGLSRHKASAPSPEATVSTSSAQSNGVAGTQVSLGSIKAFNDDQFQDLYESLALPNTEPLTAPPTITGNEIADARIRTIAESRGYQLRSVPVLPIFKTNVPGLEEDDLLQPKAYEAWLALEAKAKKDGVPLKLNSGYRSIDWQRRYFLQQLQARGVTPTAIASGRADNAVVSVMTVVAPPGYSRHHTGYTIDLICRDGSGKAFEFTPCFEWLSKENYDVAKKFGWIPSYPEGADNQGPEPEPWEYVWVGVETTHEAKTASHE